MRLRIELSEKEIRKLKHGKSIEVKGKNIKPYTKIEIVKEQPKKE